MRANKHNLARETTFAKSLWGDLPKFSTVALGQLLDRHKISVVEADVTYLNGSWYVTHSGLLKIAERRRCVGIHVSPVPKSCDAEISHWVFRAVVYKSPTCRGFVGYGDADPSNVSSLVRGAEMRVAETRAVNRALRKAYGIGICSVEEIGSFAGAVEPGKPPKKTARPVNGHENNGQPRLRDRLCQLIRQQQLDPVLVKSYALEFCRTKTLKDASREQIENFIQHLADWSEKDKNALLCQLNTYMPPKAGAA